MKKRFSSAIKSGLNSIIKISLELFVIDKKIRRVLKGKICQQFLKRYIERVENHEIKLSDNLSQTYRIWQYWDKGIDNAPAIVQVCVSSVEKYKGDFEHIVLNDRNIKDYVEIPNYIYKLRDKGIISKAHFSDILRTYLLYEYGGCWIDATVYMTGELPEFVRWSELFVFQYNKEDDPDNLNMTNYFMSSKGKSIIIAKMKRFLENYWQENSFTINYFFYAHAFTLFTESSNENKQEWSEIFNFPYPVVQQMEKELLNPYSPERFEELKSMSNIHKLSYKWNVIKKGKREIIPDNTLYQHILEDS